MVLWFTLYTAQLRHLVLVVAALAICGVTAAAMRQRSSTLPTAPTSPTRAPRPTRA